MELIKELHNNVETALVVENYPYGFRLRTQIRYWLETTNKGDRFVSQTLNPKTNVWNAEKKSVYSDVMVLVRNEEDHISYEEFSCAYTEKESYDRFMEFCGSYPFSELQKQKLAEARAIYKTREYIKVEVKPMLFHNNKTGEIVEGVPLMEMSDYEKIEDSGQVEVKAREAKRVLSALYNKHLKEENSN